MVKGRVVGTIVSTNKFDSLRGFKFLEVQIIEKDTLVTVKQIQGNKAFVIKE